MTLKYQLVRPSFATSSPLVLPASSTFDNKANIETPTTAAASLCTIRAETSSTTRIAQRATIMAVPAAAAVVTCPTLPTPTAVTTATATTNPSSQPPTSTPSRFYAGCLPTACPNPAVTPPRSTDDVPAILHINPNGPMRCSVCFLSNI